jgi:hypothetical protein
MRSCVTFSAIEFLPVDVSWWPLCRTGSAVYRERMEEVLHVCGAVLHKTTICHRSADATAQIDLRGYFRQTFRKAAGAIPQSRLKSRVKCSWLANPQAKATARIGVSVSLRRRFARSIRRCMRYWCGAFSDHRAKLACEVAGAEARDRRYGYEINRIA